MTKFETIGVQNLEDAETKDQLRRAYKWSCHCCCMRGMKLDCDRCSIKVVFNNIVAIMDDMAKDRMKSGHDTPAPTGHKK